jgi:flavoprotein
MKNSNTNGTANHNYSVLNAENEANSSNTGRLQIQLYQYFVLEEQTNLTSKH